MDQTDASWEPLGEYFIRVVREEIFARSPFYDEELRSLAHTKKARWNSSSKSWVFPLSQALSVREKLSEISARRAQERDAGQAEDLAALRRLKQDPTHFSSKDFRAQFDPDSERFSVQFPFNPNRFFQFRKIPGAEWSSSQKSWSVPIAGQSLIFSIIAEIQSFESQYLLRNAPFAPKELEEPLSLKGNGMLALAVTFDTKALTYKIFSKIPLESPLGREALEPIFSARGLYLPATESPERDLPRKGPQSIVVEACQREGVRQAIADLLAFERQFSSAVKVPISTRGLPPPRSYWRSSPHDAPNSGEIFIVSQQAYMVAHSSKAKKTKAANAPSIDWIATAVPLSHAEAVRRLGELGRDSLARCAWLSGIDSDSLPNYLEGVRLREEVNLSAPESPVASLPRRRSL